MNISAIRTLIDKGATIGEREAAKAALERVEETMKDKKEWYRLPWAERYRRTLEEQAKNGEMSL
jgi:hypothetical protein